MINNKQTNTSITSSESIPFSNTLLERLEKIKKTQIRTFNQIESLRKKIQRDSKNDND
jgi:hypothetical protein